MRMLSWQSMPKRFLGHLASCMMSTRLRTRACHAASLGVWQPSLRDDCNEPRRVGWISRTPTSQSMATWTVVAVDLEGITIFQTPFGTKAVPRGGFGILAPRVGFLVFLPLFWLGETGKADLSMRRRLDGGINILPAKGKEVGDDLKRSNSGRNTKKKGGENIMSCIMIMDKCIHNGKMLVHALSASSTPSTSAS